MEGNANLKTDLEDKTRSYDKTRDCHQFRPPTNVKLTSLPLSLSLKTKILPRDSVFYKVNTYIGYIVGCVVDFVYFLFKYPVYN